MNPRTLVVQNEIRSTTSGVEYNDTLDLSLAETVVNEAFLSDPLEVSGTLIMDLNFIRTAIRDIKGDITTLHWHDPTTTAGLITLSGTRKALNNIQTFVGADSDTDISPAYSSTHVVTQGGSLEQAIGELDELLEQVSGTTSSGTEIQKRRIIRTNEKFLANTSLIMGSEGADWSTSGDPISFASSSEFVESTSVFVNGLLRLPGTSAGSDNDVYFVSANTLAFEFNIKKNDVIQVWRFPEVK